MAISKSPTLKPSMKGTSAKQMTATGSGSRPGSSKYPIKTSAPMDPKTLGRGVPGALK